MGRQEILDAIVKERVDQDVQWGGPAHDDTHSRSDWLSHIEYQISLMPGVYRPKTGPSKDALDLMTKEYRARLVKIAALAMAAIESDVRVEAAT